jgi:N-acetylmuramoyl-L-alanine amidase
MLRAIRLFSWFGTLAAIFVFAGCETPSSNAVRATPLQKPVEAAPAEVAVVETPPVVEAAAPVQPAVELEPPVVAVPPTRRFAATGTGWQELTKWCSESGLGSPTQIPGQVAKWKFRFSGGNLDVVPGNHFAQWNGMLVGLGFPARAGRGGLEMSGVDIEKTIVPLASEFYFRPSEKILVLDPGHGGVNGGTQSPHTRQIEKNLTLDWALRIKRRLAGTGWTVMLTRTNDVDLTLAQRVALTDELQPDLFLSLHFNAVDGTAKSNLESGIETYCMTPTGLPSTITRDFEDDPMKVFPNNQFDSENLQWAVRLHHQLLSVTGAHDRGVRRARFMGVLREQRRPAVLIEGGYLSSPSEARLLGESAYREKLAWAVAAAIVKQ